MGVRLSCMHGVTFMGLYMPVPPLILGTASYTSIQVAINPLHQYRAVSNTYLPLRIQWHLLFNDTLTCSLEPLILLLHTQISQQNSMLLPLQMNLKLLSLIGSPVILPVGRYPLNML